MWSTGIVQETEIRPHNQIVHLQPRICPGEWDAQNYLWVLDTNRSHYSSQKTKRSNGQQKKDNPPNCRLCHLVKPRRIMAINGFSILSESCITESLPSDAIYCHTQGTSYIRLGCILPFCRGCSRCNLNPGDWADLLFCFTGSLDK